MSSFIHSLEYIVFIVSLSPFTVVDIIAFVVASLYHNNNHYHYNVVVCIIVLYRFPDRISPTKYKRQIYSEQQTNIEKRNIPK